MPARGFRVTKRDVTPGDEVAEPGEGILLADRPLDGGHLVGARTTRAVPRWVGVPSGTLPRMSQNRSSTRLVCASRFVLPVPSTVTTTSSSPSLATQTGLDTAAPDRRNVVRDT